MMAKSPKRKIAGEKSQFLRQSTLTTNNEGNVLITQTQSNTSNSTPNRSSLSNSQLCALVSTVSNKIDQLMHLNADQSKKIEKNTVTLTETTRNVLGLKTSVDSVNSVLLRPKTHSYADVVGVSGSSKSHPNIQQRTPRLPAYSTVLKSSQPSGTPTSTRTKRNELALIDNASLKTVSTIRIPSPKNGTKNVQIGKPLAIKSVKQRIENPMSKSVWVSKFHPDTTVDEINSYIIESTPLKDSTKFKCTKLVKKDQEIGKMSFVSFKIDVSPEDFAIISQPEYWPANNPVREFVKIQPPKPTQLTPRIPNITENTADVNFPTQ